MKAVILAGGKGTRIAEESHIRPKPMVEIGRKPIIWHIMKIYEKYGVNEFIICCGYKGYVIKDYFINYIRNRDNVFIDLQNGAVTPISGRKENWKVTLVDTGEDTLTAGRILKVRDYIADEPFFLTYGDGVSDICIDELMKFHNENKKTITVSLTKPIGRFGGAIFDEESKNIFGFREKARADQAWVNMGFMVMEPSVFDYLGTGDEMLETGPFDRLVKAQEINAYCHDGFWSPMDNVHDRDYLERLWASGNAPWK